MEKEDRKLVKIERNGKYGFADETGKEVIPCNLDYGDVGNFHEGLCYVRKSQHQYGFIDRTGKEVIPCILDYEHVGDFHEGLCYVQKSLHQYGFIDRTGKEVIPCILDYELVILGFNSGLCEVMKSGKVGFIDTSGKEIVPCIYDCDVYLFIDGYCNVNISGKWGIIDKTGKVIIPCIYDGIWLSEGLCGVNISGKWGIIDKTGKVIIPCIYDSIWHSSEGLCSLKESGKNGFIINKSHDNKTVGETKESLFQTDSAKCYFNLSSDKESLLEELTLKNYGKQKEDVVPDGTISFKCAGGKSLSFDYKGGLVTYLPSLEKWVSTAHIAVSDEDLTKILQEGTTVTTQQGETLPVNAVYEDFLRLKYLVCPTAYTDEQKAYLQSLEDKENKEAERKAAELVEKRQEEERIAAEERAKAEALAAAERAAKEREQQKQNSGCASVIVIIIIFSLFITLI